MTPVIIEQFVPNLGILDPTSSSWSSVLNRISVDPTQHNASATFAVFKSEEPLGYDIVVSGVGLTYDSTHLCGGTITSINVLNHQGVTVASYSNALPGGIALDAALLHAAARSPEKTAAAVAHWDISYSAANLSGGIAFEGAGGRDTLTGSPGSDRLSGAGGHDSVSGGAGDDTLLGDDTQWILTDAPLGHDVLDGGLGNDWLYGQGGDDTLHGDDGADVLRGDDDGQIGHDLLDGGSGSDLFLSEAGDDTYLGGAGRDRLNIKDDLSVALYSLDLTTHVATGYGNDTVWDIEIIDGSYESANSIRGAAAAESVAGGWHDDNLKGEGGNDRLWSDWGKDELRGGSGNDLLGGGGNLDTLWGGGGRDSFYFTDGGDRVEDFLAADDQVWLAQDLLPGLALGALAAAAFKDLSLGKVDSSDRVIYDRAAGKLWLDADGSGAAARTLLAQLDPGTGLSAADIEVKPVWDRDDFLV